MQLLGNLACMLFLLLAAQLQAVALPMFSLRCVLWHACLIVEKRLSPGNVYNTQECMHIITRGLAHQTVGFHMHVDSYDMLTCTPRQSFSVSAVLDHFVWEKWGQAISAAKSHVGGYQVVACQAQPTQPSVGDLPTWSIDLTHSLKSRCCLLKFQSRVMSGTFLVQYVIR